MTTHGQLELASLPEREKSGIAKISTRLPVWLSPVVAQELMERIRAGAPLVNFKFSKGERKVMRRRKPIQVSQWAEKYRIVEMSSIPGKWNRADASKYA